MTFVNEPLIEDELGQIEAVEVPEYSGPDDQYVPDPDYDPANDDIDPETQGESLDAGTPGAIGEPFTATGADATPEVKSL